MYDSGNHKKLLSSLGSAVMVICILMCGSSVLTFLSALDFRHGWRYSDEVVPAVVADIKSFMRNTNKQVFADDHSCVGNFHVLQRKIRTELTAYGSVIGGQLDRQFDGQQGSEYTELLNAISSFQLKTDSLIELVNGVPEQMNALKDSVYQLDLGLQTLSRIDDDIILYGCLDIFPCWALYGSFWTISNRDVVRNLFVNLSELKDAVLVASTNVSTVFHPAKSITKSISALLRNQKTATDLLMSKLEQLRHFIQYATDPLNLDAVLGLTDKVDEWFLQYKKLHGQPVDIYLLLISIAVAIWGVVVSVLIISGLLWGAANFQPDKLPNDRHGPTARGGHILTLALTLIQSISWALMVATTVLMVTATQLEKAGCFILRNEAANFSDLRTGFNALSKNIVDMNINYNNKSLDAASILASCLFNGSAWSALSLSQVVEEGNARTSLELLNISGALSAFRVNPSEIRTYDPAILPSIQVLLDAAKNKFNAEDIRDIYKKFRYWYNTGNHSRPLNASSPVLRANDGLGVLGYIVPIEGSPTEAYDYDHQLWDEDYWIHAGKYLLPYQPYTLYYLDPGYDNTYNDFTGWVMNYSQRLPGIDTSGQAIFNLHGQYVHYLATPDSPSATFLYQKNFTRDLLLSIDPLLNDWLDQAKVVLRTADTLQKAIQTGTSGMNAEVFVRQFTDQLHNFTLDYVDFLDRCLKIDAGRCRPVYDAFRLIAHLFCDTLLPPVNFLWFSIGFTLLLQGPTILILSRLRPFYSKGPELFPHQESISWTDSDEDFGGQQEDASIAPKQTRDTGPFHLRF
ncbi:hypothetical protein RvY_10297 [Ramazzottius varieornatus]|uniref:Uncharacterized protein n=1 Tax=Ramazzottius varieornatus TaxID=947166 RepID=A0A1D1VCA6_RAMVA|nr:hypothetical protein RvY_10297 [Ramazzottius varieornatus]